jgi:hypothetical protein
MTTTETVLDREVAEVPAAVAAAVPAVPAPGASRITSLAVGLWVVVGGLLAYGVLQTVIKASALFG